MTCNSSMTVLFVSPDIPRLVVGGFDIYFCQQGSSLLRHIMLATTRYHQLFIKEADLDFANLALCSPVFSCVFNILNNKP